PGALDFAIDLRKGFLSADRQNGMAEGNMEGENAERVRKAAVRQPAEGAGGQAEVARVRPRRKRGMAHGYRVTTPDNEHHHHDGDQLHDLQSFFAGFGNALGVLPPLIDSESNGKTI